MKTALFDFSLPPQLIASAPCDPRDAARMLIVNDGAGGLEDSAVRLLPRFLKAGDVMVFNDTKVIPARLHGKRGEAKIEILLLKCCADKVWSAFARPAKRLRIGDVVVFAEGFHATVLEKGEGGVVELSFHTSHLFADLHRFGEMPLPPYIQRKAQDADQQHYQTVYASKEGAVAAPTAGLHFTPALLGAIDALGVKRVHVTLHVGAGTFQPVKVDDTNQHIMHSEYAEISEEVAANLRACKEQGGRIIAVGTTSLRTLESAARPTGAIEAFSGETDIFITPGYSFKSADMLLTNFHLPRSTLFMLVSAFSGLEHMQAAYAHAIASSYRFYSYGDACLLYRQG